MSSVFLMVVFVLSLLYLLVKYRTTLKNIGIGPLIGVVALMVISLVAASLTFYYGGQWVGETIENIYLLVIVQFVILLAVIVVFLGILTKILKSLSDYE
ncbi:hypothetical protein [Sediminibacillus massiliensis]|uniref:hypothetical protein n=1 Tax=Sediminibacillus massiliensis TaxID=1926277 RepID=UPI000988747D|nr:hypothetical protein [Sediminibacillus massiliensis]